MRSSFQRLQPIVQVNHRPPGEEWESEEINDRNSCQEEPEDGVLTEADRCPSHNRADNASENEKRQKLQKYSHDISPVRAAIMGARQSLAYLDNPTRPIVLHRYGPIATPELWRPEVGW